MKYAKAAAVVAGSVMALGATAPAIAAEGPAELPPMSLDGAVTDAISNGALDAGPLQAVQGLSKDGDPIKPVTDAVGPVLPLLGGLQTGGAGL
ncbi:hypothetical protein [Streptomyces sp. KLOTTS4A1]|uniref:hypothetical protein n=1 Tax=Streptomyces sp. KLOTTS4A1 TaxID=3390996 RepID=UPI0039F51623